MEQQDFIQTLYIHNKYTECSWKYKATHQLMNWPQMYMYMCIESTVHVYVCLSYTPTQVKFSKQRMFSLSHSFKWCRCAAFEQLVYLTPSNTPNVNSIIVLKDWIQLNTSRPHLLHRMKIIMDWHITTCILRGRSLETHEHIQEE